MNFSQYARHRGWHPTRISIMVKEGKLTPLVDDNGKRYLISELADQELEQNTDPMKIRIGPNSLEALERVNEEIPEAVAGTGVGDSGLNPGDKPPKQTLLASKTQNEFYKAELARLKFEEEQGKLISADTVKNEAFKLGRYVRDAMLALPDRVSADLAAETNTFKIHQRLTEEIRRALSSLKVDDDGKA